MNLKLIILLCIAVCLTACNIDSGHHNPHYHSANQSSIPELSVFNIVDTYNHSSEFDDVPMRISPYLNYGLFELSWEITWVESGYYTRHNHPYRVEFVVNDRPELDGGIIISTDWCGPGEECSRFSYQNCYFNADLTMSCDYPESTRSKRTQDLSELFQHIPEQVFFLLEVCDEELFYCEYKYQKVTLE